MALAPGGREAAPPINAAFARRFSHRAEENEERTAAGSRPRGALKLAVQPGTRVTPVPVGCCRGDADRLGGLFDRQAGEVAELDDLRGRPIVLLQPGKGL